MSANLIAPLTAFALTLIAWGGFSLLPVTWQGWAPATCLQTSCFCEAIRSGGLAQPANSWSSLAFCLPGLLVLFNRSNGQSFTRQPSYRWTYGLALMVIGLGSAFYHASLTFVGQFFDVMGMYLLISFSILLTATRLGWLPPNRLAWAYLALNLALACVLIFIPGIRRETFGVLVLLTIGLEGFRLRGRNSAQSPWHYFVLALGVFGLAYLVWVLDNSGAWCNPTAWVQGHAIWHLLGALAAYFLYLHFK